MEEEKKKIFSWYLLSPVMTGSSLNQQLNTFFFYAIASTAPIIIYFNEVLSMCMIYFIILTVMRIAPLVDHLIQKPRRSIELGLSPWCSKGLFSQSHLSVQTSLQCLYSPHVQSHALRSVHAWFTPQTLAAIPLLDTRKYCTH